MKKLSIALLVVILTGCGRIPVPSSQNKIANHQTKTTNIIISVVYHNHDYTVTSQQVRDIKREIGVVSKSDQEGTGEWRTPPVGTKLFEIIGTPVNQAIAVEIKHGVYNKALIQGWFPTSNTAAGK